MRFLLLAVVVAAVLVGCSGSEPTGPGAGRPATLAGTSWRVLAVAGRVPQPGGQPPTLAFEAAQVRGSGGCNQFSGPYQYDRPTGRLAFGDGFAMTAMACQENARMTFEVLYVEALTAATEASLDDQGRLILRGPRGEIRLATLLATVASAG